MTVGCRLAAMAGMLIAGEAAGFACARLSSAWPWMAGIGVLLALAAYGWRWPHVLPIFVFIFGFVAAARTDALRVVLLERHWRSGRGGTPPNLALKVEGTVRVFNRKDGGRSTQFSSHLGPIPLKVVLPLDGEMPPPAAGEVWRCMGWVSCKTLHGGRFERRMFWGKAGTRPVRLAMPSRTECRLAALANACATRAAIGLGWCPDLAALNRVACARIGGAADSCGICSGDGAAPKCRPGGHDGRILSGGANVRPHGRFAGGVVADGALRVWKCAGTFV